MTRISSQKTRRAILATDLPWDPALVPEKLVLYDSIGNIIDLEHVQGPQGIPGPPGGSDLLPLAAQPVLDVGMLNQIRAGRQLLTTDFTNMGLAIPIGLWTLSDGTDSSGNGRHLSNKGAVAFDKGINGLANTAARFVGSAAQGLYINDTGAADPFRIKTGSWGCWFRTAKRGQRQFLLCKGGATVANLAYVLEINANNTLTTTVGDGASFVGSTGFTEIADNRWHFATATFDGTIVRLYIDAQLENVQVFSGVLNSSAAVFNLGAFSADAVTAAGLPMFGSIDEAFVTTDVLSDDQVRNLYCAKIPHLLGVNPTRASVTVRRRRRGGPLVVGDFPLQPNRLYNFTAGSLADEGSNAVVLANPSNAVAVAGAGGLAAGAYHFTGAQALTATDAGLPAGLNARSYGCWLKTTGSGTVMAWGTQATGDAKIFISAPNAASASAADQMIGGIVTDGQWHHVVVVEDNAAIDGIKRKLYVDGRLVGGSTVLNAIVLAGAARFRVAANPDASNPYTGQADAIFVVPAALTAEEVYTLHAKGAQSLGASPKNAGDHVEVMTSAFVLATFDTLESVAQVDLGVAA